MTGRPLEGEGEGEGKGKGKEQRPRPLRGEQAVVCTVLWLAATGVSSGNDWTHGFLQGALHAG